MLLEREHCIFEDLNIGWIVRAVSAEVDIDSPSAQLTIQMPQREQFIGAQKNMTGAGTVCKRLDHIQLIFQRLRLD